MAMLMTVFFRSIVGLYRNGRLAWSDEQYEGKLVDKEEEKIIDRLCVEIVNLEGREGSNCVPLGQCFWLECQ